MLTSDRDFFSPSVKDSSHSEVLCYNEVFYGFPAGCKNVLESECHFSLVIAVP